MASPKISKEDIQHLSMLARISLTDEEMVRLQADIGSILEYVSAVDAVVASGATEKNVGPVYNVFREDEITSFEGKYRDALLEEMPERVGDKLKVKKIISED